MNPLTPNYNKLLDRLNRFRVSEKRVHLITGLLRFTIIAVGGVLMMSIVEALFRLSVPGRIAVDIILLTIIISALIAFVARPLLMLFRPATPDDVALALRAGRHFGHIRDRLADAIQLFRKHDDNQEGYSMELADASLATIYHDTRNDDFGEVVTRRPMLQSVKWLLAVTLASIVIFVLFSALGQASIRLAQPTREFPRYPGFTMQVIPGDIEVLKGSDLDLVLRTGEHTSSEVGLYLKPEKAVSFEHQGLSKSEVFEYRLSDLRHDLQYYFEVDKQKTELYQIRVLETPFVQSLQVRLNYPGYSGLGVEYLDENIGDVTALKGTTIAINAHTSKPVSHADLVFDSADTLAMQIREQEISAGFSLLEDGDYSIELRDEKRLANSDPIKYRLTVTADQLPTVRITFPGQDVDLGKDMLLPLSIEAVDDFGFSSARIGYQVLSGGYLEGELQFMPLAMPANATDRILLNPTWDLSQLEIQPEDIISYFAEVYDNDAVSGFKSSRSLTYRARFPSIQEIFQEFADSQDDAMEELETVYDQSKALKSAVDDIVQQMKRDPELDWEEQKKVQDAAQAQSEMKDRLEELQQKLEEMVDRLEQNELVSSETLEKYRELQNLMEELLSPEMKELLRELQEKNEAVDPQTMKEQMQQLAEKQEDFLNSMERTINLLKKLQIEQKLDEVTRKTEELLRRQEELNREAQESSSQQQKNEKYAREQESIKKDTGNLEETLEDLNNRMSEFPQMSAEQIEAATQMAGDDALQQQMQEAAEQFQSGQQQDAQKSGQQIQQGLQQMVQMLQQAKKEMTEDEKRKVMQAMRRSSNDLLNLSQQQEELMQETRTADRNSPGAEARADKQHGMLSGLSRVSNQMYELSQETFFVTPEIGQALGESLKSMQDALQQMEQRDSKNAGNSQSQAMSSLNEASYQIRQSMQQMQGASSSIGFQEMMQRLTSMSQQQQGVNQQTSALGQGSEPGQQKQRQGAMSRLGGEQESIRQALEQLMKEAGNRSDLLGDMQQVEDEMADVVSELQGSRLSGQTIQKQERILSRLLDAQRSIHNRDYSKKRRPESGKSYQALSPAELPPLEGREKDRLRAELLRSLKEGYSKDYQKLIRLYFEALAQEELDESPNN